MTVVACDAAVNVLEGGKMVCGAGDCFRRYVSPSWIFESSRSSISALALFVVTLRVISIHNTLGNFRKRTSANTGIRLR